MMCVQVECTYNMRMREVKTAAYVMTAKTAKQGMETNPNQVVGGPGPGQIVAWTWLAASQWCAGG